MRRMVSYGNAVTEETLNTAYAILRDPDRRARLDKALEKRRRGDHKSRPSFYQKLQKLIVR